MKSRYYRAKLIKEITFSSEINVKYWFNKIGKREILSEYPNNHHIVITNKKMSVIQIKKIKDKQEWLLKAMVRNIDFDNDINVLEWWNSGGKNLIEKDFPTNSSIHIFKNTICITTCYLTQNYIDII